MTANFLIGLREGLEATLVVVLLMAYLAKTGRARLMPRVWAGVGAAAALSAGFGALLTFGPRGLTFEAQEAIGGILGREGLETALFLWAAARATGETWEPVAGAVLGIAAAILLGFLLHQGVLRINLSRFFTWTGAALIIVAGGVLAYGVHDLQEAGILPGLHTLAFDVSAAVPPGSWYGTLLKGVFNFSPATTTFEAAAWLLYVVPTMILFFRRLHSGHGTAAADRSATAAA